MPAAPPLAAGHEVGPFRLVRTLGRGGHAPVFLAEEIHDGRKLRDVALKLFFLLPGVAPASSAAAAWREAVLDEARALCRVEHPGVVRFHAVHRDDARGLLALVMEHVAGESLDVRLRAAGPLDPREVAAVGVEVAWALSAVHQAGLVHRDVKPGNIVAGASGYKLIDFGIVAAAESREAEAALVGTVGYVAPERLERGAAPSPAADLYALGVTLFQLLTGAMPGGGGAVGVATLPLEPDVAERDTRELTSDGLAPARSALPSRAAALGGTLGALIGRLLEPDPRDRPQHAEVVARELSRLRGAELGREDDDPEEPQPATVRIHRRTEATPLCARPALVGRERELGILRGAAEAARAGALRLVVVTGPLGVGRTRLLEEAVQASGLPTGRVIAARCSPERQGVLSPLTRALESLPVGSARALAALEEAVELAVAPEAVGGARDAESAVEGVEDALLFASAREPLVLVIDDVQWGDAYTLTLLRLLLDRAVAGGETRAEGGPGGLLVIAAARHEPSPAPALGAFLGRVRSRASAAAAHVDLGPLPPAAARSLAQAVGPLDAELGRAVVRGSGGVPFFLVHALTAWRDTEAIVFRDGAWRAADERALSGAVPGVAEIVEARLAACFEPGSALARAALRALAAVALYGGGLGMEILLAVERDGSSLELALEALADAGLVTVTGERQEHGFAQEMVRQAVLNLARTRPWFFRLHRALLDAIAARPGATADAAFLATGYEKVGATEPARRWLALAMDAASAAGLAREAADLGDRLAALASDAAERTAVEVSVVDALLVGRKFEEATGRLARLAARLSVLPDAETRETNLRRRIDRLRAARGLNEAGVDDAALAADADAHGDLTRSCEARLALAGVAPEPASIALAGEAVALAPTPALEFAARVLRMELAYASNQRDFAMITGDLERALAIATATSSTWQRIHVEGDLAAVEAEQGKTGAAIARVARLFDEAEVQGMRGQARLLSQNLAALLLRAGRAAEAAETAARTARLALDAGDPVLAANAMSVRADALRRTGDLEGALGAIGEAERLLARHGDRMRSLTLLRRAEILGALGRGGDAAADAAAARAHAEAHGEQGIALTAALWEALHRSRQGAATAADLQEAIAAVSAPGVAQRALTRSLLAQAEEHLAALRTG